MFKFFILTTIGFKLKLFWDSLINDLRGPRNTVQISYKPKNTGITKTVGGLINNERDVPYKEAKIKDVIIV